MEVFLEDDKNLDWWTYKNIEYALLERQARRP